MLICDRLCWALRQSPLKKCLWITVENTQIHSHSYYENFMSEISRIRDGSSWYPVQGGHLEKEPRKGETSHLRFEALARIS